MIASSLPKKADLQLDLDPAVPPLALDPGRLQQVLLNLVINAGEALTDGAGVVTIQTGLAAPDDARLGARAEAETAATTQWACIEVSDDGAGMDADTQAHIFDPFFTTKFHAVDWASPQPSASSAAMGASSTSSRPRARERPSAC